LATKDVTIDMDVPNGLWVDVDRSLIEEAVANLVQNALDATPVGGEITITGLISRGALILEVADSGPGLPKDAVDRVFEPLFSTKPGAAGLGLATVARIASAHGGNVIARDCPEGGAAFTLYLPQTALKAAA
jgi:signal transduction histidine kinase